MSNAQTANALDVLWRQSPGGELLDLGRAFRAPLGLSRLHTTPRRILSRRETALLAAFALVLHGAVIYWVNSSATPRLPVVPPEIPPMTIEFSQAAPPVIQTSPPPPEPAVQPVIEPPPPLEDELAVKPAPPKPVIKPIQTPKPAPKPVAKPFAKPVQPLPVPSAAPQPVAASAPPAPPAPAPVTPASASAGYLHNPAPEYPPLAMRRNWEGTVMLRVHVLGTGKPSDIQIQTSSGHEQLDEAAQAAVKRWSFVPARQGDTAIDGWVSVPVDFKIK